MSDSFAPGTVQDGTGHVLPVSYGDDTNFVVEFYTREVEDVRATRIKGRRILKGIGYCRKYAVGDQKTVWDAPITEEDRRRFPGQFRAYDQGEKESVVGTPLEAWPLMTRDMQLALKNHGFKTVEQVANVSDGALAGMETKLANLLHRTREHAQKFIDDQKLGENERRLADELEARDSQIAAMQNQMQAMQQRLEQMQVAQIANTTAPGAPAQAQIGVVKPPEPEPATPDLEALEGLPEVEPLEPVGSGEWTVKRGYQKFIVVDPEGKETSSYPTKAEAEKWANEYNREYSDE